MGLDVVPIWVREGAVLCWAKERMRTWDEVGEVVLVQCFGEKESWTVGDGNGGVVEIMKRDHGKLVCEGRKGVAVELFV